MSDAIKTPFRIVGDDYSSGTPASDVIIGQGPVLVDFHCSHALPSSQVVTGQSFGSLTVPHCISSDLLVVHILIRFGAADGAEIGGADLA